MLVPLLALAFVIIGITAYLIFQGKRKTRDRGNRRPADKA